jgi:hypothetical protein
MHPVGRTAGPTALMGQPRTHGPFGLGWKKSTRAAIHRAARLLALPAESRAVQRQAYAVGERMAQ